MFRPPRIYTHMGLAVLLAICGVASGFYLPLASWNYRVMLVTGYLSLVMQHRRQQTHYRKHQPQS